MLRKNPHKLHVKFLCKNINTNCMSTMKKDSRVNGRKTLNINIVLLCLHKSYVDFFGHTDYVKLYIKFFTV